MMGGEEGVGGKCALKLDTDLLAIEFLRRRI